MFAYSIYWKCDDSSAVFLAIPFPIVLFPRCFPLCVCVCVCAGGEYTVFTVNRPCSQWISVQICLRVALSYFLLRWVWHLQSFERSCSWIFQSEELKLKQLGRQQKPALCWLTVASSVFFPPLTQSNGIILWVLWGHKREETFHSRIVLSQFLWESGCVSLHCWSSCFLPSLEKKLQRT